MSEIYKKGKILESYFEKYCNNNYEYKDIVCEILEMSEDIYNINRNGMNVNIQDKCLMITNDTNNNSVQFYF